MLKKMKEQNIKLGKNGEIDADTFQIFKTMDASDDETQAKADAQLKAAMESGKLSQSMLDKMDVVVDYIFNLLYKTMMGIWKTITDLFGNADTRSDRLKVELDSLIKEQSKLQKTLNDPNSSAEDKSGDTTDVR